ncbi:MAG: hypothetical protein ACTSQO_14455 [Candidatus Helarchaeota archaeon]
MSENGNEKWKEGIELLRKKNYKSAINKFNEAITYFDNKNDDLGKASSLLGLALANISLNNDEIALKMLEKGINIVKKINFKPGIAAYLLNKGILFQKFQKFDMALDNYNSSLKFFSEINDINSIKNVSDLIEKCKKEKTTFNMLRNSINNDK